MVDRSNRTGAFEIPQDPKLPDLFRSAMREVQLSMRTHSVATIVTYNPATQKATVTVDALQVFKDTTKNPTDENPNPTKVQAPITLTDIPVAFPRTNSGYITFPLNPGDTGELHIQDRSLEQWLKLGLATDPVVAWTHNLADSVFHPTLHDNTNPITPPTRSDGTVIDGTPFVHLGAVTTDFAVLALALQTYLISVFTLPPVFPTDGGLVLASNIALRLAGLPTVPPSTPVPSLVSAAASTKVKVE